MMATRQIQISTDVYAAIWSARKAGENSEEEILRRVFNVAPAAVQATPSKPAKIGFSDPRFGIALPEGFEIFRTYKGTEYRAKAVDGKWLLLKTGASYPSLNQLSRAVSGNVENAWSNWYYVDNNGKRELVTKLRN